MTRFVMALGILVGLACNAEAGQNPFVGEILIFAGNFCPKGYHATDGSLLPISQNDALFSILGTTYGGNGTSNFALPNTKPIYTATRATFTQCIALLGIFPSRD